MASKVNDIRKSELECLLGIAEYLLARGRSADVVAQAICADARLTASRAMGIDFTPFAPRYLRTVAQRCRELADALDDEALKLAEKIVEEKGNENNPEHLPDGRKLLRWQNDLLNGHDHYWNFHDTETEWAEAGCPVCKLKQMEGETEDV